ncbi:antitoxin VbhA family protein [Rhodococcus sp. 1168]|uniref:antitoxin VbhA family protein n=1 Tax=Rhodococcus sp. 1168 TaxID=2018041 RepID=UPI001593B8BD|nr:antitoxin VbhA family protein [Rhodococcus sp. 1168]
MTVTYSGSGGVGLALRRAGDRARAVDAARTSCALEGGRSTDATTRADQEAYVRGEIDIVELGCRVRGRYNVLR